MRPPLVCRRSYGTSWLGVLLPRSQAYEYALFCFRSSRGVAQASVRHTVGAVYVRPQALVLPVGLCASGLLVEYTDWYDQCRLP